VPKFQKQGIGGSLIKRGLKFLSKANVGLNVCDWMTQLLSAFRVYACGKFGFETPFPIPEKDADAWMVQALRPNVIGSVSGTVVCCDSLNPEHWRE